MNEPKKLPPYSRRMAVPTTDSTVFVHAGWASYREANAAANAQGCIYITDDCPYDYDWSAVAGHGVIVLDYVGLAEGTAQMLACALRDAGATTVIWANIAQGHTSFLIEGPCNG